MDNSCQEQRSEELHLEEEFEAGTSQRTRGPSIPKWTKQLCSFDSSGKCISDNSSAFSRLVAVEVQDNRNFPLERDWRKIKEEVKEVLWNRIKGNIFFEDADIVKMPIIRHMTLKVAEHAHKDYRNKLKKEHYSKRAEEELSHPPPEVNPTQWAALEVAEKNKINRKKKTMNHTIGTKSFARKRQEFNQHGKEVDPVTFFRECHTRKDKSWIDETSERTATTMEGNLQNLIESGQEDNEELRTRVYVDTMGPETHNRVRGYGHEVTPDMVSYACSSSSTSNSSKRSSNSAMALLMTENNVLRMREENTNKRLLDLEGKFEHSNQLLAMFLQKFQPQPSYSSGTQQSGQGQPPQQSGQSQPPQQSGHNQPPPAYPYAGHNQQPSYHMYPMPTPMSYMHQPPMPYMQHLPMSYMQQPPHYQTPVYRPEMAAPAVFCPEVPVGGFSGMLAGGGFDVDFTRYLGADGGSQGGE
ncbi:uncharacterized protein LOC126618166 [Malus sylvestris]|uniref:uncharacterized protein LOC126618166 n=1 Tax=Malus sylvestris TaxID=3752 RepID=UPI0021ACA307|nr:uncharacterized protein LOC126618166 [Malus sylvestris]